MYRRAAAHLLYISLSLLFASRFFPLLHPTTHAMTNGDPALACWVVQWMSHALVHDPLHLYSGNTFYPYAHAIVLSDPMLTLAVLNLPVRLITANPWVGYNLLILLAYYWSCVSGAALARIVTRSEAAAVWGGLFWGFLFYRVHHIGHIQILSFQWIPLVVVWLVRLWERPTTKAAALFALTFVAQALVSWYLAVVTAVVVVIVAAGRPLRETLAPRLRKHAAVAVAAVSAIVLPFAWPYRAAFQDSTLSARRVLVGAFGDAVHLRDYLTPPMATVLGARIASGYSIWGENTLYVGFVPLILAAVAITWTLGGWTSRPADERRWLVTGLALVASGYVLALGFVSPSLGITLPLGYAARIVAPLAGLRATQRFSLIVYFGVLILSSLGVARLVAARAARVQAAIAAACACAFLFEVFPFSLPISASHQYGPSAPDVFIARYQKMRAAPLVVLHLPIFYFSEPYPVDEATYMVDSTWHWARIVNGFSGAEPAGFADRMRMLNTLPTAEGVAELRRLGVDVVAVHGDAAHPGNPLWDYFSRQPWARVIKVGNNEFVVLLV